MGTSSSVLRVSLIAPDGWDSQRFLDRELLTVRSTQTVVTTASVMSTANPLLPEIALIMVTLRTLSTPSARLTDLAESSALIRVPPHLLVHR